MVWVEGEFYLEVSQKYLVLHDERISFMGEENLFVGRISLLGGWGIRYIKGILDGPSLLEFSVYA